MVQKLGKILVQKLKRVMLWRVNGLLKMIQNLNKTDHTFDHDLLILDRCHNRPLGVEKFKHVKNSILYVP
jgi:hypothetical protein